MAKGLCSPVATSFRQAPTLDAVEEGQVNAGKWGISKLIIVCAKAGASVENLWAAALQEDKLFYNSSCSDVMDVQMLLHIFEIRNNI